ncbi:MAG: hypothetical protein ACTHMI_14085 [Mucilaginibacter sp.]
MEACAGIILNDNEIIKSSGTSEGQGALYDQFNAACAELKQRMISEAFGPAKDHVIRRYVQFHQAGLITLSDRIFQQVRKVDVPIVPGKSELLIRALETLQQLLDFIGQQFYRHFDVLHGISQYASDITSNNFRTKVELLSPLLERQPIEPSLITVFYESMEECLDQLRLQAITYEQANYIDQLLKLVHFQLEEQTIDTARFANLLYRQNFNSTYFESWYRKYHLTVHTGQLADEGASAIEPVIQELGIFPHRKAIDVLLREWTTAVLSSNGEAKRVKAQESKMPRLPLILSVPQLALFVRLCYLEGCFQISNISNIMRFFTDHFESKKQPKVSLKSFNRAFYTSDQGTAAIVRDFLQRMIITIDKTYFPKT